MEISKELLGVVLGKRVIGVEKGLRGKCIRYCWDDRAMAITQEININELAYKIEDWIESKDINVIRIKENKLYEFYINAYIDEETNELFFENSITSETKIKGIIVVGEFILKEINEK